MPENGEELKQSSRSLEVEPLDENETPRQL